MKGVEWDDVSGWQDITDEQLAEEVACRLNGTEGKVVEAEEAVRGNLNAMISHRDGQIEELARMSSKERSAAGIWCVAFFCLLLFATVACGIMSAYIGKVPQ